MKANLILFILYIYFLSSCGSSDAQNPSRDFSKGKQHVPVSDSADAMPDLYNGYWKADIGFESPGYSRKNLYAFKDKNKISLYIICRLKDHPHFFKQIDMQISINSKKITIVTLPKPEEPQETLMKIGEDDVYSECNIKIPDLSLPYTYDRDHKVFSLKISDFLLLRWSPSSYEEIFID